ncbi:HAD-IIA family hydrolase [Faecalispora jeddahensis]|uniref:HAD-IIA family hydrolase n=1 Tax=Faecalispora jeddahensis TaxID=1414721 RepID=UPI0027B9A7C2|nr:HAD-IIA family hydrolase [Faecalispora jeddahensis]
MQYLINQDSENRLSRIRCFALDMDGTVYLGSRWIDGAREFLHRIEETGRRFCFLTNNSSKNARCYFEKLADMGLPIQPQQLVTSGHATVAYLKKHHPGKKVFLLGNPQLCEEFISLGIPLEEDHPDLVVTAFDTSLTYAKMCRVCDLVRAGLPYLSTHPDLNCPTETGFVPDSGAIHAFIHASAGRWPDEIIGKPNRAIIDFTLEQTGSLPEETAMVGDRLYTDIAAGVNNGLTGILVLSGEAALKDIDGSDVHPDLIFNSVKEMIPLL